MVLWIVLKIGGEAAPAMKEYGVGFLGGRTWDPNPLNERYGILPQIWGTLYSSLLALVIGTILGLSVAVFLSERFLGPPCSAG